MRNRRAFCDRRDAGLQVLRREDDLGLGRRGDAVGELVRVRLGKLDGECRCLTGRQLAQDVAVRHHLDGVDCPVDHDDREVGLVLAGARRNRGCGHKSAEDGENALGIHPRLLFRYTRKPGYRQARWIVSDVESQVAF